MGTFLQAGIIIEFSYGTPMAGLNGVSLDAINIKVARTVVDSTDFLGADPSDADLISWAEDEGFLTFYPSDDRFRIATVNGQEIRVNVTLVSLSSEGKVLVEEMQQLMNYKEL